MTGVTEVSSSHVFPLLELPNETIVHVLRLADEKGRRRMAETCSRLAANAFEAMPPLMRCLEKREDCTPFVCDYEDYIEGDLPAVKRRDDKESEASINERVCPYIRILDSSQHNCEDLTIHLRCALNLDIAGTNTTQHNDWSRLQEVVLCGSYGFLIVDQLTGLKLPQLSALTFSPEIYASWSAPYISKINNFIAAYQQQLRCFRMDENFCCFADDSTMTALAQCSSLDTLILPGAEDVSSDALIQVAKSCTKLQAVDLSGCDGVTDGVVEAIAINCFHLCAINLSKCKNITSYAVKLLTVATDIEAMDLYDCAQLTDKDAVAQIVDDAAKGGKLCQKLSRLALINPKNPE